MVGAASNARRLEPIAEYTIRVARVGLTDIGPAAQIPICRGTSRSLSALPAAGCSRPRRLARGEWPWPARASNI